MAPLRTLALVQATGAWKASSTPFAQIGQVLLVSRVLRYLLSQVA
jgi:hypothetical protein